MVLSPNSACFSLKVPDPRPVPLELLTLGVQFGEGQPPPASGPWLLGSTAAASAAAISGQTLDRWGGDLRPLIEEGASADKGR